MANRFSFYVKHTDPNSLKVIQRHLTIEMSAQNRGIAISRQKHQIKSEYTVIQFKQERFVLALESC